MPDKVETTIDGKKYTLELLGAKKANHVLLRLVKILGGAVGPIMAAGRGGIPMALAQMQKSTSEADVDFVIDAMALKTTCDLAVLQTKAGARPVKETLADVYDQHWGNRLAAQWLWLGWAIKENFADFFVEARRDKAELMIREFAPDLFGSDSPTDSTGSSGES